MSKRPAPQILLSVTAVIAALGLVGCKQGQPQGGGMPPAMVSVATVQPHDVPVSFTYVAQTEGSREVEVRAQVGGILLERHYQEGTAVKQGTTLFTIDQATYRATLDQAAAELEAAQARLNQATRDVARLKPLFADKAVAQKDYDDAVSAEEMSRAQVSLARARLAQARLNLGYAAVKAPISGIAGRALKSEGNLLVPGADSLLTTLVQVDPIYVTFNQPDSDTAQIKKDVQSGALIMPKDGRFGVRLTLADGSDYSQEGTLNYSETGINLETGTIRTRASFANPNTQLLPGQFVRLHLTGAQRPGALTVPQRAVADGPMGKFVYVVGKGQDGKPAAELRPIVVGEWVAGATGQHDWVVRQGLKAGDQVIVEGRARLYPGAAIAIGQPGAAQAPGAGSH